MPYDLARRPDWKIDGRTRELAVFQRWLAGRD
jgi:hypothetical protein